MKKIPVMQVVLSVVAAIIVGCAFGKLASLQYAPHVLGLLAGAGAGVGAYFGLGHLRVFKTLDGA